METTIEFSVFCVVICWMVWALRALDKSGDEITEIYQFIVHEYAYGEIDNFKNVSFEKHWVYRVFFQNPFPLYGPVIEARFSK